MSFNQACRFADQAESRRDVEVPSGSADGGPAVKSQSMPRQPTDGQSPTDPGRTLDLETQKRQSPWELEQFQSIQRSSQDRWNRSLWDQGWIIREHHKLRKRLFHPVHRGAPMDASTIEVCRVTSMVSPQQQLVRDEWTSNQYWEGNTEWIGYTFFKRKPVAPESDQDSFELVGP